MARSDSNASIEKARLFETRRVNLHNMVHSRSTGQKLAYLFASTPGHISLMTNGKRPITDETARGLEQVLGLSVGWLDSARRLDEVPPVAVSRLEVGRSPVPFPVIYGRGRPRVAQPPPTRMAGVKVPSGERLKTARTSDNISESIVEQTILSVSADLEKVLAHLRDVREEMVACRIAAQAVPPGQAIGRTSGRVVDALFGKAIRDIYLSQRALESIEGKLGTKGAIPAHAGSLIDR